MHTLFPALQNISIMPDNLSFANEIYKLPGAFFKLFFRSMVTGQQLYLSFFFTSTETFISGAEHPAIDR
jgi:hypothetical protein